MVPFSFSTCSTQITFSNLRKTCKVPIYLNLRRQNCYGLDENWKKFRQINMKFLKNYLSIMSPSDIMILVTLLEASAVYIAALNFDLLRSACWHLAKSETAHPVFCTVGVKKIWICNKQFYHELVPQMFKQSTFMWNFLNWSSGFPKMYIISDFILVCLVV